MKKPCGRGCDACRRVGELEPVTIGVSPHFDGAFRSRVYVYLCPECHGRIDMHDEMIGPTLAGSLCTMIRAMRVQEARRK